MFPPVEIDGRLLVDGGLVDNVPAGVVRAMGADVVVAVDVARPPKELAEGADVLTVVNRMTELMMSTGNRSFAEPPDVRIRPDFEGVESDFDQFEEMIERGRKAGLLALADVLPRLCGRRAAPRPVATEGSPEARRAGRLGDRGRPAPGPRAAGEAPPPRRGGSGVRSRGCAEGHGCDLGEQSLLIGLAGAVVHQGQRARGEGPGAGAAHPSRRRRAGLQRGRQRAGGAAASQRKPPRPGRAARHDGGRRFGPRRAAGRHGQREPRRLAPGVPHRGEGRGGQAPRLRQRGQRHRAHPIPAVPLHGKRAAGGGPRRPLRPGFRGRAFGGGRAGGHSLRGARRHGGEGRGPFRHRQPRQPLLALERMASRSPGRAVDHRARCERPLRARVLAGGRVRAGGEARPSLPSPVRRGSELAHPRLRPLQGGRAHPHSGPQPRGDLGPLGRRRLRGAGRPRSERSGRSAWSSGPATPGARPGRSLSTRFTPGPPSPSVAGRPLARSRSASAWAQATSRCTCRWASSRYGDPGRRGGA